MPSCKRFTRAMVIAALSCAASIVLALAGCSSSSGSPASPDAKLNQNLVHEHLLGEDDTVKPHQTVVLNLSALKDDHLSNAADAGYHKLPYEILDAGKYKYCIPADDTNLTVIEMFNPVGTMVGRWQKGEACTSVPLDPGTYTMHVHLEGNSAEPIIFMKPQEVTVTPVGMAKRARRSAAGFPGQIPVYQFLNLKVNSLLDVLSKNKTLNLQEGWGISAPFPGQTAYPELKQVQYGTTSVYPGRSVLLPKNQPVTPVTRLNMADLFYLTLQPGNNVTVRQGDTPVVITTNVCKMWTSDSPYYCFESGDLVSLQTAGAGTSDISQFVFSPTGAQTFRFFRTYNSGLHGGLYTMSGKPYSPSDPRHYTVALGWSTDSYTTGITFGVTARYGTTSGLNLPAMLANEVALFDAPFTQSGFPANTHYWIVSASQQDFTSLSFDNPANRIKSVIAGRGVRAQVFRYAGFQGDSLYVSPPVDGELILTGTDSPLLGSGSVGSVRIEANTDNIPVNEYERHIIVSTNTCIGCDLRGFDAAFYPSKTISNVNFTDSDLSYSTWQNSNIVNGSFQNVNFTGATFTMQVFDSCNFTGTDFTKAVFKSAKFQYTSPPASANAFYNACPKFEYTDLTSTAQFFDYRLGFDSYFPVGTGSVYNADTWWNTQRSACRTSIAHSKVAQDLFLDKRLWQFVDAPGVDFSNMNLDGAYFTGSDLTNALFRNTSLRGAVFVSATLSGADFTGADLTGAHLEGAILDGVDLHKAKTLSKASLGGITLKAPNLSGLDMSGAQLQGGLYTNWDGHTFERFAPLSAIGAYMYNTMLNGADLSGVSFESVSWFGTSATGENAIMAGAHFEHADMPGLNLKKAHLQGANFTDTVLVNANLSTSSSADYSFDSTVFYQANLKGANLSGANLSKAVLAGAYVYAGPGELTATLEVLDDPVTNPGHYRFIQQAYSATLAPASTDGITSCPNGLYSATIPHNCGDIGSIYWQTLLPPRDPDNCFKRPAQPGEKPDDQGMVLQCDSKRHPVTASKTAKRKGAE